MCKRCRRLERENARLRAECDRRRAFTLRLAERVALASDILGRLAERKERRKAK